MHPSILYLSSMPTTALLASSNLLNVGSALPSEQDMSEGQERTSERDSVGKSLMPYQSLTTHAGILARAAENHIAPSPGNDDDGNMTSNLRIVYHTWSMFIPSADAARSLCRMYKKMLRRGPQRVRFSCAFSACCIHVRCFHLDPDRPCVSNPVGCCDGCVALSI